MHILQQPVDEVRQRLFAEFFGKAGLQIVIALHKVLHRLGAVGGVEGFAAVGVERIHGGRAFIDMQIE